MWSATRGVLFIRVSSRFHPKFHPLEQHDFQSECKTYNQSTQRADEILRSAPRHFPWQRLKGRGNRFTIASTGVRQAYGFRMQLLR